MYQKDLEKYRTEESEQIGRVNEWDVAYEKMLQKQEFEQANLDRIEGEQIRNRKELDEVQSGLDSCLVEIENRQQNMEKIRETILASHTAQSDV